MLPPQVSSLSRCVAEVELWEPGLAIADGQELLGLGLHASLRPLLEDQRGQDINDGYDLVDRIELQRPMPSGKVLGYEPLGFFGMSFHSWLCCSSPDNWEALGIRPGRHGWLADFDAAARVCEHQRLHSEPAIWLPWLILRYDPRNIPAPQTY